MQSGKWRSWNRRNGLDDEALALHEQAIRYYREGITRQGMERELFIRLACKAEVAAADMLGSAEELARWLMYESAATMALEARDYERADQLFTEKLGCKIPLYTVLLSTARLQAIDDALK
jgi:hypothetical protein